MQDHYVFGFDENENKKQDMFFSEEEKEPFFFHGHHESNSPYDDFDLNYNELYHHHLNDPDDFPGKAHGNPGNFHFEENEPHTRDLEDRNCIICRDRTAGTDFTIRTFKRPFHIHTNCIFTCLAVLINGLLFIFSKFQKKK